MIHLEHYRNQFAPAAATKLRTLKLSYAKNEEKNLRYAVRYVLHKLEFQPLYLPEFDLSKQEYHILMNDAEENELMLEVKRSPEKEAFSGIVFYTDNCLRDYHKYILLGVEFISRPEYCEQGLMVKFIAPNDSVYTLLERRIYSEKDIY